MHDGMSCRECRNYCIEEEKQRHKYALGEHFEHLNRRMGMDMYLDGVSAEQEAPYEEKYEEAGK